MWISLIEWVGLVHWMGWPGTCTFSDCIEFVVLILCSIDWLSDWMWTDWLLSLSTVSGCMVSLLGWLVGLIDWLLPVHVLNVQDWLMDLTWINCLYWNCYTVWLIDRLHVPVIFCFDVNVMLYSNDWSWLCGLDVHLFLSCLDLTQCLRLVLMAWSIHMTDWVLWMHWLVLCMVCCLVRIDWLLWHGLTFWLIDWLIDLAIACIDCFDDQIWFRQCKCLLGLIRLIGGWSEAVWVCLLILSYCMLDSVVNELVWNDWTIWFDSLHVMISLLDSFELLVFRFIDWLFEELIDLFDWFLGLIVWCYCVNASNLVIDLHGFHDVVQFELIDCNIHLIGLLVDLN